MVELASSVESIACTRQDGKLQTWVFFSIRHTDLGRLILGGPLYFVKEGLQQRGGQLRRAVDEPLTHDQACALVIPRLKQAFVD
jgi:hypothetical protein